MAPEAEAPRDENKLVCLKSGPAVIGAPVNTSLFENGCDLTFWGSLWHFVFLVLFVFASPPQSSHIQITTTPETLTLCFIS